MNYDKIEKNIEQYINEARVHEYFQTEITQVYD